MFNAPSFLLETSGGRISLTRSILFYWFIFTLLVGLIATVRLLILGLALPDGSDELLSYIEMLSPSFVGGYALGKKMVRIDGPGKTGVTKNNKEEEPDA